MNRCRYVEIEVDEIVKETADAFLVNVDGEEIWLPKSQIEDSDTFNEGDAATTMNITRWIAEQKGIEVD